MTQDRRIKTHQQPTEALVFTDTKLIEAAQEHLRAESAAACLLAIPETVPALHIAIGTKDAMRGLLRDDPITDTEPLAGQVWTAPLGSAAAAQAAVPAELANMEVLTASEIASRPLPAGRQFVRLTDVQAMLGALAAPAVPSPPLSEGLTDERIDEIYRDLLEKAYKNEEPVTARDIARAIEREVTARLSVPPSPTLHGAVGAEWECLDRFEQWAEDEGHGIGPRSEWANNRSSTGFLMWIGWQGVARKIDATPVATQSGAAAAPVDRNAVLEEAAHAVDAVSFGHHAAMWAQGLCAKAVRSLKSVSAPDGGDDRKETGE